MRSFHVLLATALLTTVACSSAPNDDGSQSSASSVVSSNEVRLTKADDGKTVRVNVGQDVILTLPDNASTGYTWQITSNDLGDPQVHNTGDPSRPGAGGHVVFTWSTAGASSVHTIELVLQRPWAETVPPIDHFTVTLDIEEPGRPSHPDDCRTNGCDDGKWCSFCWGTYACIPKGAMC